MANTLLNKNYLAEAAIAPFRIVKMGAADGGVLLAAAATDSLVGVCEAVGPALGERVDVIKVGLADVELGGAVVRGGPITSDATGKGVAAAPAAGVNNRVIGFAEISGVAGDIIPVFISPCVMQG